MRSADSRAPLRRGSLVNSDRLRAILPQKEENYGIAIRERKELVDAATKLVSSDVSIQSQPLDQQQFVREADAVLEQLNSASFEYPLSHVFGLPFPASR